VRSASVHVLLDVIASQDVSLFALITEL